MTPWNPSTPWWPRSPQGSCSPPSTAWRSTASTGPATSPPATRWPWSGRRTPGRCRRPSAGRPRTASGSCRAEPGSGLSGGSTAVDGGIVLSLERMDAVEIDTASQVAVVEPGAFNAEVKRAAAEHGLWYPPDPSSYEICSIGGNVATNAGGLCCVKYGVTTDYVLGLDVVLADGTLDHPGRQADQGRRRAAAAQALRRQRGHPRHRHPGDPAAGARAGARGPRWSRSFADRAAALRTPSSRCARRCGPRCWS